MIHALLVILSCQLVGEVLARLLPFPLPGPVIGMMTLLAGLALSKRLLALIRPAAQGVLAHLSLLFVPAGVGVIGHLAGLGGHAIGLLVATVVSTALAIAAGAWTFLLVARLTGQQGADGDD
ncbi:putative effector of murein hydrolase LrgA (UPF0299 family) [Albidovulum inexpectatum]|uniref:Putative effector of murein hydrolase LrgA (UPF0299 family) n=1 Tax=Albidovulum inexpectatum TaxID=196587 RepID=A0A2S5JLI0_9RHOB|nr:CidA/LrgA family protein [Albidovulum inexpectatum]PPB82095.1 putative effector of murein hydrolase LrgA (UPF0299 family) [Albidovulum inexpectatum]